jgi:hypothetical protein
MKFVKGERGQAFSVFWLLVAAIIAIAILVLLLGVFNVIPIFGPGADPINTAAQKITDLRYQKGTLKVTTEEVTFQPNYVMTSAGVISTGKLEMDEKQICLSIGDFGLVEDSGFSTDPSHIKIDYKGTAPVKAKLAIICNSGWKLPEDVARQGGSTGVLVEWLKDCPAVNEPLWNKQLACFVALKTTGTYRPPTECKVEDKTYGVYEEIEMDVKLESGKTHKVKVMCDEFGRYDESSPVVLSKIQCEVQCKAEGGSYPDPRCGKLPAFYWPGTPLVEREWDGFCEHLPE